MTRAKGKASSRPSGRVIAAVRPTAERLAAAHGLTLWNVSFSRIAGRETLRVAADRVGGVGADDLAVFADDLSRELDHLDAVPGNASYVLEVTSPGAERTLHTPEHYRICRGRDARITFTDGRPALDGTIGDITETGVEVATGAGTTLVPFDEIARAQLRIVGI